MAQTLSAVIDTLRRRRIIARNRIAEWNTSLSLSASGYVHDPTKPRAIFFWNLVKKLQQPDRVGPKALRVAVAQFNLFFRRMSGLESDDRCDTRNSDEGTLFADETEYLPHVEFFREHLHASPDSAEYYFGVWLVAYW
jgi:hypothetical protein